jgi:hypothetical protein
MTTPPHVGRALFRSPSPSLGAEGELDRAIATLRGSMVGDTPHSNTRASEYPSVGDAKQISPIVQLDRESPASSQMVDEHSSFLTAWAGPRKVANMEGVLSFPSFDEDDEHSLMDDFLPETSVRTTRVSWSRQGKSSTLESPREFLQRKQSPAPGSTRTHRSYSDVPSPIRTMRLTNTPSTLRVSVSASPNLDGLVQLHSADDSGTRHRTRSESVSEIGGNLCFSHTEVRRMSPDIQTSASSRPRSVSPLHARSFGVDFVMSPEEVRESGLEPLAAQMFNTNAELPSEGLCLEPSNDYMQSSNDVAVADLVNSLEAALPDFIIERMLAFPIMGYDDNTDREILQTIHSEIENMYVGTMPMTVTSKTYLRVSNEPLTTPLPSGRGADLVLALDTSYRVSLWARSIAEIIADVRNARESDQEALINMSAPFVLAFHGLVEKFGYHLSVSEVLENNPLLPRYLSRMPPLYMRSCRRTKVDNVSSEGILLRSIPARIADADFTREIDSLVATIKADARSFKVIRVTDMTAMGLLHRFISRYYQTEHLSGSSSSRKESIARFCDGHGPTKILKGLGKGLRSLIPDQVPIEVTRIAVGLLDMCVKKMSWKHKLDLVSPLLQDGIHSVSTYQDTASIIKVMPGSHYMPMTFIEAMRHFTKLDLQNEVLFFYSGTEARGDNGPRTESITKLISYMTESGYGMFVPTDSSNRFLRPAPPVNGKTMNKMERHRFRAFGRLLGLAIRYDIRPGVMFSSSAFWLMEQVASAGIWDGERTAPKRIKMSQAFMERYLEEQDPMFERSLKEIQPAHIPGTTLKRGAPLTGDNIDKYRTETRSDILVDSVLHQMRYVVMGMADTIKPVIVQAFTAKDFRNMIQADPDEISVALIRENTSFDSRISEVEKDWLWSALESFTVPELKLFLTFVSGSPYPPLSGMKDPERQGREWLHVTRGLSDQYYPMSHICHFLLDLPEYPSAQVLRDRFITAITLTGTLENE